MSSSTLRTNTAHGTSALGRWRAAGIVVALAAALTLGIGSSASASSDWPAIPASHCGDAGFNIAAPEGHVYTYGLWSSDVHYHANTIVHTYIVYAPSMWGPTPLGDTSCSVTY